MNATVLRRRAAHVALIAGAVFLSGAAAAGDRPATPEGAKSIEAFFDRFLPAQPSGAAPLVAVKPDGDGYLVTTDLAALNGFLSGAGAGVTYESTPLVYRLTEQDDGKWRIVQDSLPKIVTHAKGATSAIAIDNYRQTLVIDPALAWWVSGAASANRGSVAAQGPTGGQTVDFGPLKAEYTTTVNANGTVSSTVRQDISAIAFKVDSTDKDGRTVSSSGRIERAAFNVGVDGLHSRKLFDLVTLLSAHRADLAAHEQELKDLLRPLAAPGLRFIEGGEASKLMIGSPIGAIAVAGAKLAIGVTNAGPASAVDATIGVEGLSLPAGLAPPGAADLTPSKIDVVLTFKGFDIAAAANQAIDSFHLSDSGPVISDVDSAKVSAALIGAGPLKIVLAPSHIVAPAIDADVQGELRYVAARSAGAVTIRMRGFDRTMKAIQALGPEVAMKSLPVLAMAKGLARNETDGALSWIVEVGEDRSIKINGVPIGKAPQ